MLEYPGTTDRADVAAELYGMSVGGLTNPASGVIDDEQSRGSAITVIGYVNVSTGKPPVGWMEHL